MYSNSSTVFLASNKIPSLCLSGTRQNMNNYINTIPLGPSSHLNTVTSDHLFHFRPYQQSYFHYPGVKHFVLVPSHFNFHSPDKTFSASSCVCYCHRAMRCRKMILLKKVSKLSNCSKYFNAIAYPNPAWTSDNFGVTVDVRDQNVPLLVERLPPVSNEMSVSCELWEVNSSKSL